MDLVGLTAVILSLGGPIAVVIVLLVQRHKKNQKKLEAVMSATQAGRSIDEIENILDMLETPKSTDGLLKAGMIIGGIGLGTILIALFNATPEAIGGGAFVIVLGAMFVLTWFITDRRRG